MNKRKLRRKKNKLKRNPVIKELHIRPRAEKTALAASKGEEFIDYVGNFVFFSTSDGDAWMLDHRHNYALRLAHNYEILPYGINENRDKFQVEWKERFKIENGIFTASKRGTEEHFKSYPVDAIQGIINMIKLKESRKSSPAL